MKDVRQTATKWGVLRVLGLLAATSSVISLAQRISDVGIAGILGDYLAYYHALSQAVFGLLPSLVGWQVPQWLADLWAISFFGLATLVRTQQYALRDRINLRVTTWTDRIRSVLFTTIQGFCLFGLVVFALAICGLFSQTAAFTLDRLKISSALVFRELVIVLGLALFFFAINAYGPAFAT